jgi:hypothetical protein
LLTTSTVRINAATCHLGHKPRLTDEKESGKVRHKSERR